MKAILTAATALILIGCTSSQQVVDDLAGRYVGRNVDRFFIDYGAPAQRHDLNGGGKLYVWESGVKSFYVPPTTTVTGTSQRGYSTYTANTVGGDTFSLQCVVQIETSSDGTIASFRILRDSTGMWNTSRCAEYLGR